MEKRTIWVKPSCFTPEIEMIIPIPEDRDAEEYIDEFLDTILCEDLKYNVEWGFFRRNLIKASVACHTSSDCAFIYVISSI